MAGLRLLDFLLHPVLPKLGGDGVMLRLPRATDYEDWRSLRDESRAFLTPWEPQWTADELSRRAFDARLRRTMRDARERAGYTFFVFDASGRTLFGGATLGQVRRGVSQSCTLGYWMGERHAGAGHMRRAVDVLESFAFEIEGLHRMEAACLPSNTRSIRLLESAGFSREGHLRDYLKIAGAWEDHYLYSLIAEDWTRSRARSRLEAVTDPP